MPVVDGQPRHLTLLLAEKAIEFVQTNPAGRPFCLSVSFKSPHGRLPDPDMPDPYEDIDVPLPSTRMREDFESEPIFLRRSLNAGRAGNWRDDQREVVREKAKARYRLITGVDTAVGKIMTAVEGLGLADDTVVIFTSDNGRLLGDHDLFGKWIMYESSIRVPLIIRDPRSPDHLRGSRREETVLNIDLAPTMLALGGGTDARRDAGARSPAATGRSWRPVA